MQVDAPLVTWISNYLTGQPQYVRLQTNMSYIIQSNMGAPQGMVLSPFLVTLQLRLLILLTVLPPADVFRWLYHCGLYQQDRRLSTGVWWSVLWTRRNPVCIRGTEVDIVEEYKYLGVNIDNKLNWTKDTRGSEQERSEPPVVSQETQIFQCLQNHAADVLSLGGGQRHLLRCSVLGQQREGCWCR